MLSIFCIHIIQSRPVFVWTVGLFSSAYFIFSEIMKAALKYQAHIEWLYIIVKEDSLFDFKLNALQIGLNVKQRA